MRTVVTVVVSVVASVALTAGGMWFLMNQAAPKFLTSTATSYASQAASSAVQTANTTASSAFSVRGAKPQGAQKQGLEPLKTPDRWLFLNEYWKNVAGTAFDDGTPGTAFSFGPLFTPVRLSPAADQTTGMDAATGAYFMQQIVGGPVLGIATLNASNDLYLVGGQTPQGRLTYVIASWRGQDTGWAPVATLDLASSHGALVTDPLAGMALFSTYKIPQRSMDRALMADLLIPFLQVHPSFEDRTIDRIDFGRNMVPRQGPFSIQIDVQTASGVLKALVSGDISPVTNGVDRLQITGLQKI